MSVPDFVVCLRQVPVDLPSQQVADFLLTGAE
jgi:hypothetical protein